MAVALEFLNLIVPIGIIRQKYRGGWEQCLLDYERLIGGRVWFDDWLFRDGAMSSVDIGHLADRWMQRGFQGKIGEGSEARWNDFCVVSENFRHPTLRCDWIVVGRGMAHLAGQEPGKVVGRNLGE